VLEESARGFFWGARSLHCMACAEMEYFSIHGFRISLSWFESGSSSQSFQSLSLELARNLGTLFSLSA